MLVRTPSNMMGSKFRGRGRLKPHLVVTNTRRAVPARSCRPRRRDAYDLEIGAPHDAVTWPCRAMANTGGNPVLPCQGHRCRAVLDRHHDFRRPSGPRRPANIAAGERVSTVDDPRSWRTQPAQNWDCPRSADVPYVQGHGSQERNAPEPKTDREGSGSNAWFLRLHLSGPSRLGHGLR